MLCSLQMWQICSTGETPGHPGAQASLAQGEKKAEELKACFLEPGTD